MFSVISIIGRSGAGKGTQVDRLERDTGFTVIRTGDLLRARAQETDVVGTIIRETLEKGGLIPTPIVFSLWMPRLEKAKNDDSIPGIIFDGNPRKLYEAHMLDEVLTMFGWSERFRACHIRVSEEIATRRLIARARHDDIPEDIQERMKYFHEDVEPALKYYNSKKVLIEVNGEDAPEAVYEELQQKLSHFLQ